MNCNSKKSYFWFSSIASSILLLHSRQNMRSTITEQRFSASAMVPVFAMTKRGKQTPHQSLPSQSTTTQPQPTRPMSRALVARSSHAMALAPPSSSSSSSSGAWAESSALPPSSSSASASSSRVQTPSSRNYSRRSQRKNYSLHNNGAYNYFKIPFFSFFFCSISPNT